MYQAIQAKYFFKATIFFDLIFNQPEKVFNKSGIKW